MVPTFGMVLNLTLKGLLKRFLVYLGVEYIHTLMPYDAILSVVRLMATVFTAAIMAAVS
jgi:hypothetical protein